MPRRYERALFVLLALVLILAFSAPILSLAETMDELPEALFEAFKYSQDAIVEEFLRGREATCGVIENFRGEEFYTLLPIEIVKPDRKLFDYELKYENVPTHYNPGHFSEEEKEAIQHAAKVAHQALGLRHYSRSDMIVRPNGRVYVFEINTLPGITEHSLLPTSLRAVGFSLKDFLNHVLNMALSKRP